MIVPQIPTAKPVRRSRKTPATAKRARRARFGRPAGASALPLEAMGLPVERPRDRRLGTKVAPAHDPLRLAATAFVNDGGRGVRTRGERTGERRDAERGPERAQADLERQAERGGRDGAHVVRVRPSL